MSEWIVKQNTDGQLEVVGLLVRCKECKYFKKHTGKYLEQRFRKDGICRYHNYEETMAEEFCSKGIKE